MSEQAKLIKDVQTGVAMIHFRNSMIGKYMIKKATEDIRSALMRLKDADPHDFKSIQALQNDIKVAESFQIWIEHALMEAEQAEIQLDGLLEPGQYDEFNNEE